METYTARDAEDLMGDDDDAFAHLREEDDCEDPGCQRERGHAGLHMSRTWDSWNCQELIDEWDDEDPPGGEG